MRYRNRSPEMIRRTLRVLHVLLIAALIGASMGSVGLWRHSYTARAPKWVEFWEVPIFYEIPVVYDLDDSIS